ncbi:hypothetical protein PFISCL1PPCAC_16540, partial [Pristionchus fissidentatus]
SFRSSPSSATPFAPSDPRGPPAARSSSSLRAATERRNAVGRTRRSRSKQSNRTQKSSSRWRNRTKARRRRRRL